MWGGARGRPCLRGCWWADSHIIYHIPYIHIALHIPNIHIIYHTSHVSDIGGGRGAAPLAGLLVGWGWGGGGGAQGAGGGEGFGARLRGFWWAGGMGAGGGEVCAGIPCRADGVVISISYIMYHISISYYHIKYPHHTSYIAYHSSYIRITYPARTGSPRNRWT